MLMSYIREFAIISLIVLVMFGIILGASFLGYRVFRNSLWVGIILSIVASFYVAALTTNLYLFLLFIPSIIVLIVYHKLNHH